MDPERAHYLRAIERRFLEMRGRGLMLSPRDVQLVDTWRERDVPIRVVLAALEDGAQRFADAHPPGTPLPSSLAYFAGHVDRAVQDREELVLERASRGAAATTAGTGPKSLLKPGARQALQELIAEAGRRQPTESAKEALRYAWRRLVQPSTDEALWDLTAIIDRDLVDMLAASLDDLSELEAAVEQAVKQAGGGAMSAQAQQDVARAEKERWVRERFGVQDLMEVLIDHTV